MIFKCKMCGAPLEVKDNESVTKCDYCSTEQTLPKLVDERIANLYDRANHFRRNNDYDKAMSIYESILNDNPNDAESYWSIVLCKYGIEYVEDPQTHKRIPTVNRVQFTSIYMDDDYKSALKYADLNQKVIYEEEAKKIDEIQRGILQISSKEEPFDVFICYKETDENGRRTRDSVLANELYHELTQEGYKVFYSRITLEDKIGSAYEPYIFAALNSAKVMVVLGTNKDYFNAVWVKNEWSRYLSLIKKGERKTLIPAYKDMDAYDLPEEFSHLQALNMDTLGFMLDLVRGIKKIVGSKEEKQLNNNSVVKEKVVEEPKQKIKIENKKSKLPLIIGSLVIAVGIVVACLTLFGYDCEKKGHVLSDWLVSKEATCLEEGSKYIQCTKCKEVIETKTIDALGHDYSDFKVSKEATCSEDGERYQECSRCGNKIIEVVARLGHQYKDGKCTVCGTINCMGKHTASSWVVSTEATCTATGTSYQECTTCHEILKTEVISKIAHSYGSWTIDSESTCSVEGSKHRNCSVCGYKETITIELKSHNYVSGKCSVCGAAQCNGNHTASNWVVTKEATCAETGTQVKRCTVCNEVLQQETISKLTTHTYGNWTIDSDSTCSVQGSKHKNCTVCGYKETATIELKSHNYVSGKCSVCGAAQCAVGDVITFGSYEQDNNTTNGKEDIEWIVLAIDDNKMLVTSKYALDCKQYNTTHINVTWETCTLRSWLNGTFLNDAFSSSEQAKILTTTVIAEDNPDYGTEAGNNTNDKIFLLSISEANKYFSSNEARKCTPTAYAVVQNVCKSSYGTSYYWLINPGHNQQCFSTVNYDGSVNSSGYSIYYGGSTAIRPAMWISLE